MTHLPGMEPQYAKPIQDFVDMWNANSGRLPKVRIMNDERARLIRAGLKAEPDLEVWAGVARLKAKDEFWIERRYGLETMLRAEHRAKYLEDAMDGIEAPSRPKPQGYPSWEAFYQAEAVARNVSFETVRDEHERRDT